MKIALAQINPTIGDIKNNFLKIISYIERAISQQVEIIIFPELAIVGYPPQDLLYFSDLLETIKSKLTSLKTISKDIAIIIGAPIYDNNKLYNSALFIYKENIIRRDKTLLPTYDVFDETRYFKPAQSNNPIEFKNYKLGLTICEDIWNDKDFWNRRLYDIDPVENLVKKGVDLIINISASPYHFGKKKLRYDMLKHIAKKYGKKIIYVNQVGGNDELIFDGTSMVIDEKGNIISLGKSFQEDFFIFELEDTSKSFNMPKDSIRDVHDGLVLGIRDYFNKTGFNKAVIGLSGGIDSSVVACLAVDALGNDNVLGILMPSRYSSKESLEDAISLCSNLWKRS